MNSNNTDCIVVSEPTPLVLENIKHTEEVRTQLQEAKMRRTLEKLKNKFNQ